VGGDCKEKEEGGEESEGGGGTVHREEGVGGKKKPHFTAPTTQSPFLPVPDPATCVIQKSILHKPVIHPLFTTRAAQIERAVRGCGGERPGECDATGNFFFIGSARPVLRPTKYPAWYGITTHGTRDLANLPLRE
jgi:hypothetical protein